MLFFVCDKILLSCLFNQLSQRKFCPRDNALVIYIKLASCLESVFRVGFINQIILSLPLRLLVYQRYEGKYNIW